MKEILKRIKELEAEISEKQREIIFLSNEATAFCPVKIGDIRRSSVSKKEFRVKKIKFDSFYSLWTVSGPLFKKDRTESMYSGQEHIHVPKEMLI